MNYADRVTHTALAPGAPNSKQGQAAGMTRLQDASLARAPRPRARLGHQFSWLASGKLVAAALQAAALVLIARVSGPEAFAIISLALALSLIVQVLANAGLTTYVLRTRAVTPLHPLITPALKLTAESAVVSMTSLLLALFVLAAIDIRAIFLLPLAAWAAAESYTETLLSVCLADGDVRVNIRLLVLRRLASVGSLAALLAVHLEPLFAFSVAMAVPSVVASLYARRCVKSLLTGKVRWRDRREVLRDARHFWWHSVATQLRNLDVFLVSAFAGLGQAAFYAAASRITGPLRILPISLATVLLPASAKHGAGALRPVLRPASLLMGGMLLIHSILIVIMPWVVPLLLGAAYMSAIAPMQVITGGLIVAAFTSMVTAILQGVGLARAVGVVSAVGTFICLVSISVGSLRWGALGAAYGLGSSLCLQAMALTALVAVANRRERATAASRGASGDLE